MNTRGKDKAPRKHRSDGVTNREIDPGINEKYIEFIRAITPPCKPNPTDIQEMQRRFQHYLDCCKEFDMKVGNLAAYQAIGISKQQASEWTNTYARYNPERAEFILGVQRVCSMYREILMQDGKINPITGIFWQKNFDGFKDQTELVVPTRNPLGELSESPEKMQKRYLENTFSPAELVQPRTINGDCTVLEDDENVPEKCEKTPEISSKIDEDLSKT